MKKISFLLIGIILTIITFGQKSPRTTITLNAVWKFKKGEINLSYPKFDDPTMSIVNIPHTWNTTDVYDEIKGYYRGTGWYITSVVIDSSYRNKKCFLHFEGANQETDVYVNGQYIGKHKGGYTAFTFDITKALIIKNKPVRNEIAVKVDNQHNPSIAPLSADFTMFGGLYRDVYLITTSPIYFNMLDYGSKGVFIETPEVSREKATVKITGSLINKSKDSQTLKIVSVIRNAENKIIADISSVIKADTNKIIEFSQTSKPIAYPHLWSITDPYLHSVSTRLIDESGNIVDEVINPLGFRWYKFDANRGFYLNDQPIKLIGASRHQFYPGLGSAMPDELQQKDIALLKEMGGNFYRTSHYPHDQSVIEACDKLGIIVSIEIPLVNTITESEEFFTNSKNAMLEMIHQYRNHPSIIIWCMGNEIMLKPPYKFENLKSLTPEEQKYVNSMSTLFQDLQNIAKKEDPARYTMIAHHGNPPLYEIAKLTKIPDINGWNLYTGWYRKTIKELDETLAEIKAVAPDKPIIISEYGAGSDTRIRSQAPERFDQSIEYQNDMHEYYLKKIKETPYISGGLIWCLVDFSSEGRKDANPHINNKGVLTEYRQPKDAYYLYKANFSKEPFLKIAPVGVTTMKGFQDDTTALSSTQVIWVYSNMDKIELILNRKSIDRVTPVNGVARFKVPLTNGKNYIEALAVKNGQLYKDFAMLNMVILPLQFNSKTILFNNLALNCGATFSYTDNSGTIWMPDKAYQPGNYGYIGGNQFRRWKGSVAGTDSDIFGTEDDPIYQTQRDSVEAYKFDVPDGNYKITLLFAELQTSIQRQSLIYNLGNENDETIKGERVFDVVINNEIIWPKLNIAQDFGEERAVFRTFFISTENNKGITISFISRSGKPVINGINITKL